MKILKKINRESIKKSAKSAGRFVMENKLFCLRLGIMAATVIMTQEVAYAKSFTDDSSAAGMSVLTEPMTRMKEAMTGPIPKALVTIGAAVGAASWAMNIENQITKTAMRVIGGGSIAVGAGTFMTDTTGFVLF